MERVILCDNKENPKKGNILIFDFYKDGPRMRLRSEEQEIYRAAFSAKEAKKILNFFTKVVKKM